MSTSQPHFGGHGQSTREICGILWATGPPRAGRGLLIGGTNSDFGSDAHLGPRVGIRHGVGMRGSSPVGGSPHPDFVSPRTRTNTWRPGHGERRKESGHG